jgi:phage/plasmid-associated DNA primase
MIVLRMTQSFYGKEDTELATKLMKELSGIFNWAMVGQQRRVDRGGHFLQPKSGLELLEVMEELSNPLKVFIEDVLVFDLASEVDKDELFAVYKHWAHRKSINPGTDLTFKRRFIAATQDQAIESAVSRQNGERRNVYRGVRFTDKAQQYVNTLGDFREEIF